MFPSINTSDNPFESLFKRPSFLISEHQNPNSKQDDNPDPPFLFNFPSLVFDEHDLPLNQMLSQNYHYTQNQPENNSHILDSKMKGKISANHHQPINPSDEVIAPLRRRNLGPIPRRRTGKKDRHSKICTAQGIRDRRMRLSLQVARKFFDLQDMLGYDKASKTIEWLFTKSKKAIKELVEDHPEGNNISISDAKSESFISECEVVSGTEENSRNDVKDITLSPNLTPLCVKNEVKLLKNGLKPSTRESREKARARARSRTREKMMINGVDHPIQPYKPNPNDNDQLEKLGFSSNSPFEVVDQKTHSHDIISSYESVYKPVHEDVGTIEKLLGNSSSVSSWPISDYQSSDSFMGFIGNWDFLNNDKVNSIEYGAANHQVSLAGNPNSI